MESAAVAECSEATRQVAQVVTRGLAAGRIVEIDGLGTFYPDVRLGFRFEPQTLPQIFLAYVKEDEPDVSRLYAALEASVSVDGCPQTPARPELAARHPTSD